MQIFTVFCVIQSRFFQTIEFNKKGCMAYNSWYKSLLRISGIFFFLFFVDSLYSQFYLKPIVDYSDPYISVVNDIYEDSKGFIWIGARNGLFQYNGYEFKKFDQLPWDDNSISNNKVTSICEDHDSVLWIGTEDGLNIYDWKKNTFRKFFHSENNPKSLSSNWVKTMINDKKGNFWIGTNEGLNKIIKDESGKITFERYYPPRTNSNRFNEWSILDIEIAENGQFWLSTWEGGLYQFDPENGNFITYRNIPDNNNSPSTNIITNIEIAEDGKIYLGMSPSGINIFDPVTMKFQNSENNAIIRDNFHDLSIYALEIDSKQRLWIGSRQNIMVYDLQNEKVLVTINKKISDLYNQVFTMDEPANMIYEDKRGAVWIGYYGTGLDKYDTRQAQFTKWFHPIRLDKEKRTYIHALYVDNKNNIWAGSANHGMLKIDSTGNIMKKYSADKKAISISSNNVQTFLIDDNGYLWIGTFNGLNQFDPVSGKVIHKVYQKDGLKHNNIRKLYPDKDGTIWIITQEGINHINPVSKKIINDPISTNPYLNLVTSFHQDFNDNYWIGTRLGAYFFDKDKQAFRKFQYNMNDSNSLSNSGIMGFFQNEQNSLWIATDYGLNRLDLKTLQFEHLFESDGLIGNNVMDISEDNLGNLWIVTSDGISRFNPKNKTSVNYGIEDGLNIKIKYISFKNGYFYVTSENGFFKFPPETFSSDKFDPPLYFTDLLMSGKTVEPGSSPLDNSSIIMADKLMLKYNQNDIVVKVAALDYNSSQNNRYRYLLKGQDISWHALGNKREIPLINLEPGNYKLLVQVGNNDYIWSDKQATLDIVVTPPFWKTNWAYIIYFVLLVSALFSFRYTIILKETNRAKTRMNEMKMQFFHNIAHEFKTPLTLILGPIERTLQKGSTELSPSKVSIIYRNALRINNLIDQILHLRKFERGKLKLESEKHNIELFLEDILPSYQELTSEKNIEFNSEIKITDPVCWFDEDKLEKIINNLITNAFNNSNPNGKIEFIFEMIDHNAMKSVVDQYQRTKNIVVKSDTSVKHEKYFKFSVIDNGLGIDEKHLKIIFNRFEQFQTAGKNTTGFGIGLSLTKDLITLYQGTLVVKSIKDEGSEFTVIIPTDVKTDADNKSMEVKGIKNTNRKQKSVKLLNLPVKSPITTNDSGNPLILVIEDNLELQNYICDILRENYNVKLASDGETGFNKAKELIPDLIISDILMPKADGVTICKMLREDEMTSHIPIILLTAKDSNESMQEGYSAGADDYVIKPFNADLLLSRITNLIEIRKKIRNKYKNQNIEFAEGIALTQRDDAFIYKLVKIVEENISNPMFRKEELASKMYVSTSQLYRKIKALTNQSVKEFINGVRLKTAADILSKGKNVSIADLAYLVGFSSPSYFTKLFREYYGETPTQYMEKFLTEEKIRK